MVCLTLFLKSLRFTVFSPISIALHYRLYTLCMVGILKVFHAGKSMGQIYAVATIDSNSCFYATTSIMSQILPLSSIIFLPFLTSIEFHQEMTTSLTAVINWMSNHETYTDELFITAYACPDWLTAPFLSIASIQTVQLLSSWNSESLKIAFTNTLLCYFVSCDEFCQV